MEIKTKKRSGTPNKGVQKAWREQRRTEGDARNQAWRELSPTAQLHILDKRLGRGKGARRQRAKIASAL